MVAVYAAYKVNTPHRFKIDAVKGLDYRVIEFVIGTNNICEVMAEFQLRFPGYAMRDCIEVPVESFDAEQAVLAPRPKSLTVAGVSIE